MTIRKFSSIFCFILLAGCVAQNSGLHNLEVESHSVLFDDINSYPQVKFNFSLPNNWQSQKVKLSSVGVEQAPTPVNSKSIKSIAAPITPQKKYIYYTHTTTSTCKHVYLSRKKIHGKWVNVKVEEGCRRRPEGMDGIQ